MTIPPTPPADAEVAEPRRLLAEDRIVVDELARLKNELALSRRENARLRQERNEARATLEASRREYAMLRITLSALAATAPQTAPAQPAAQCAYLDHDLFTNRRLRCRKARGHDGLHAMVFADDSSEPTAADPEPVRVTDSKDRCTATTVESGVEVRCEYKRDHGGWHDAALPTPPERVGWSPEDQLPPWAHPAGDEHLQALRDGLLERGFAPGPNLVGSALSALDATRRSYLEAQEGLNEVSAELDATNADHGRDMESWRRDAEALAEARREAERLRGEVTEAHRDLETTRAANRAARERLAGALRTKQHGLAEMVDLALERLGGDR